MREQINPDGSRLPTMLDPTANGEFVPIPRSRAHHAAYREARAKTTTTAHCSGMKRRDFLVSF